MKEIRNRENFPVDLSKCGCGTSSSFCFVKKVFILTKFETNLRSLDGALPCKENQTANESDTISSVLFQLIHFIAL